MRQTLHTAKNEISTCESLCCSRGSRARPTFERPTAAERGFVCCTVGRDVLVRRRRQRKRERRIAVPQPPPGSAFLNASDVNLLVQTAATTGNSDSITIAVVDRLGLILAVWQGSNAPAQSPTTSARWSTRRTSRYRWLVRLHSSAMTRHRCRRAQCGSSVVFTSRRALRTRRAPICTASRIRIVGAPFRQTTFRAKLFRCPLCRPHDAQSSRYHHRQGRPNGSRRKRHGSDRRCSDCRMPWII
jgi:hypothetical protein